MASDRLLTEIERQKKYLSELPEDFGYPLFNVARAVESQRASGYRTTAAAAREILDNGLEAGARNLHVVLDADRHADTNRRTVSAIAFIDDGSGMLPPMLRYALTWGGGTHFEDHGFIGKFGFGLPNSSINQTKRVEVFSRVAPEYPIMSAFLDISHPSKFGLQSIDPPTEAELPAFAARYMERNKLSFDHGTVVVWQRPDRLSYKKVATLKESMLDDFGVTYRYLLHNPETNPDGVNLFVEGVQVAPVDPLFLTPGARFYVPEAEGGAEKVLDRSIPVRFFRDEETGESHLYRITDDSELEAANKNGETVGAIHVAIARLPVGFAPLKGGEGDAARRFEIRKAHRGMSFVRAGREIQTIDVFPRTNKDKAGGLGDWPLLQSYAYHWGIEVRFGPELDDAFGITNDKQSVRPMEDFWRVLAQSEIDTAARNENTWQSKARKKAPTMTPGEEVTPAESAARTADLATDQRAEVPERSKDAARKTLDTKAKQEAQKNDGDVEAARKALEAEANRRPYLVDYVDRPNGPWFEPEWANGGQLVIKVNRQHQFYQVVYGDMARLKGAERLKLAIDFLLITLGKSELTISDEEMAAFTATRRRYVQTPYLDAGLAQLAAKMQAPEEDEDVESETVAGKDVA